MLCSRYSCWPRILIFSSFSLSSRKVLIFSIRLNLHGCALCFNRIRSIMHLAVKKEIRTHRIYTMYDYSPPIQTICLWYLFFVRIIFHATRQLSRNFLLFFYSLDGFSLCALHVLHFWNGRLRKCFLSCMQCVQCADVSCSWCCQKRFEKWVCM